MALKEEDTSQTAGMREEGISFANMKGLTLTSTPSLGHILVSEATRGKSGVFTSVGTDHPPSSFHYMCVLYFLCTGLGVFGLYFLNLTESTFKNGQVALKDF